MRNESLPKEYSTDKYEDMTDSDKVKLLFSSGVWRFTCTRMGDDVRKFQYNGALEWVVNNYPLEGRSDPQRNTRIVACSIAGTLGSHLPAGYLTFGRLKGKCAHPVLCG